MNLYLIGYRYTGKTSVGRQVAQNMLFGFINADDLLAESCEQPVSDFVAVNGPEALQRLEIYILKEIARKNGYVVVVGDGIALQPDNITRMQESGVVIWLQASVETILERMRDDDVGLTGKSIAKVLSRQAALYKQATDYAVDTDGLEVDEVCAKVLNIINT